MAKIVKKSAAKSDAAQVKADAEIKSDVRHSVPMPDRPAKSKTSKLINIMKGKATPASPKVKNDDRPVVEISEEMQQKFVKFAALKTLFDTFESAKKSNTGELYSSIMTSYQESLWTGKSKPKNPAIKVKNQGRPDSEGIFIVSTGSKIKINMPPVQENEDPEEAMLRGLIDLGVSRKNAENLIEKEISFVPQWNLNFTDLLYGSFSEGKLKPATEVQVSASEALFSAINGLDEDGNELTSKERIDLLKSITDEGWFSVKNAVDTKYFPKLLDGENFLDRVCNYANSIEELKAILTMFVPVHFLSHTKFGISDTVDTRNGRLIDEAVFNIRENLDD